METLVEVDRRRRAYLTKLGRAEHTRYLAHDEPDGTIVLTPAVVMAEHDLRLLEHPAVLSAIDDARAHPERLIRGRHRPATVDR